MPDREAEARKSSLIAYPRTPWDAWLHRDETRGAFVLGWVIGQARRDEETGHG